MGPRRKPPPPRGRSPATSHAARDGRSSCGTSGSPRRARSGPCAQWEGRPGAARTTWTRSRRRCCCSTTWMQNGDPHSAFRILLVGALAACGSSDGPRVTVTIPPGASLDAAVDSLAANHVIAHPGTFRLYARLRGLAGSLKSGVYLLRQDESWSDVVAAL